MRLLAPLLLLVACADKPAGDTGAPGDDSASDTDTDTAFDAACATLSSGDDWAWQGECPQMRTPCDIVVTECSLAIDYDADGGMTMGMPYAGTIEGDTITFADGDSVSGCVGTIEDADTVTGTCADGCTFTLRR